jgi:two-component system LytT family sensor kinase
LAIGCIFDDSARGVGYDLNMAENDNRSGSPQWVWIGAIWFGFALIDATQIVAVMHAEGMHHAWLKLFATTLLSWLPWALTTMLVLRYGGRFPAGRWRSLLTGLAHIAACFAAGLTFAAWTACLEVLLNPYAYASPTPFRQLWFERFYGGISGFLVLYAAILTVSYVLEARERLAFHRTETARLNEQLVKAQLHVLRRQIEPHFLFNTLNSVSGLVREGRNDSAVSMIAGLSDLLRRVLEDFTRNQVPLQEEMEFAQKYLDIQKVRFAERLQVRIDVPSELNAAQVPSLLLQPMVENAIKHGIAKRARGGTIRIAASQCDGMLTLCVVNDGPGLPPNWETAGSGIGMANVRTRLMSLYGDSFELGMRNGNTGGVEVSVSLPLVVVPHSREA